MTAADPYRGIPRKELIARIERAETALAKERAEHAATRDQLRLAEADAATGQVAQRNLRAFADEAAARERQQEMDV